MCENAKNGNFILAITYKWKALALLFSMKTIYSKIFTQDGQSGVFYSKNSHIRLYIHLKDITTRNNLKLRLKQRCVFLRWNLQRRTTSNQRYNVRQRRNNVVIFNVEFHNVRQSRNSVVEMTIFKKNKKKSFQVECTEFKVLITIS